MNYIFLTGLLGLSILILGAATPESKTIKLPIKSTKNWLLALGSTIMFTYSIMSYLQGESIFFVFSQSLIIIASILMMLNIKNKIDLIIIFISGSILIIWSLFIFENYNTLIFIFGLIGIGFGYILKGGTIKKNLTLTIASLLIALFSYIETSWIFFWLNIIFAIFSGYYVIKQKYLHEHNFSAIK